MALPKAFWLLWCGQTFSRLGIIAPAFLVLYLQEVGVTSGRVTPVIVALFAVGVLAAGLVGGVIADMIGPRRTIILAQPAAVLTALLFLAAGEPFSISALAFVAGFLSAVDRPAGAGLVAKLVPEEQFTRAYSMLLVGFNVGMSLGPILAGALVAYYPPGLFLAWAASSVLYVVLIRRLPVDERVPAPAEGEHLVRRVILNIMEPFRSRAVRLFLVLCFLVAAIYLQLNSTLPLDMRNEGITPAQIGVVLAVNAVLSIILLPFVPRLTRGMSVETPLIIASALIAVGFGLNAVAHGIPMYVIALVIWTLGEVFWAPMSATFLAKQAPAGRVSIYQGTFFFAWNAGFVVGGPIGILVANAYGYGVLWVSALLLGICTTIGFFALPRMTRSVPVSVS